MTFLSMLYTLIISPLELLFEVIFSVANRLIGNVGLSIIFLSLAVNFLVLPLYKRADELQNEERDIQAKMAHWIKHIKTTFTGDERFFMLQEYYRINHYKPVYALKSSVSVLLQIPFFIAAYNLLSGMTSLQGMSFGFIPDLGKEDAMFTIGGFPINVLPILMTLINIVSGIIYTKGHPLKEKIQVYGLAAVFLVLLYRSPAGLVFYWLLNNVFSLVKNIFYKLKDPKKVLSIVLAVAGLALIISTLIRSDIDARQKVLLSVAGILLMLPLAKTFVKAKQQAKTVSVNNGIFFAGTILMALITGLLIPSSVISNSTEEFADLIHPYNPALYIVNSSLLSFGSWVLWGGVFYFFMSRKTRETFSKAIWVISGISLADYFLFGTKLGILSSNLQYVTKPVFNFTEYSINLIVVILLPVVLIFLFRKLSKYVSYVFYTASVIVLGIGVMNSAQISAEYNSLASTWFLSSTSSYDDTVNIPLSRNGKNVVILMLDRAMGSQLPYIFNEKPELKTKFDGFTFYPNTISFGPFTIYGSPAIFGGYEYTPERINERSSESLVSKHNEALKVLPVVFGNNGYTVTVCDPPFAGYNWIPDLSIFDDHPEFHVYNTNGRYNYFEGSDNDATLKISSRIKDIRNRNFFMFSIMKISPVIIQETIYDSGLYNEAISLSNDDNSSVNGYSLVQTLDGISKSTGYYNYFLDAYPVLTKLSELTTISDGSENTFFMMDNDTIHSPCLLQKPDYTPSLYVDNTEYDRNLASEHTINGTALPLKTADQNTYYHVNMATYMRLGEWFDFMREHGVYDNTRIIIVADHGRGDLLQFPVICNKVNMEYCLPLLMVKDFNAKGFTTIEEFMTNADTPTLAMNDLINNPVNPFTGKPINSNDKNGPQKVFMSNKNINDNTGNTFLPGSWYTVSGNPHEKSNWKYIGDH